MHFSTQLKKLKTTLSACSGARSGVGEVLYFWGKDDALCLNNYLGAELKIVFSGHIFCQNCGKKTNKSFQQGHCFVCMRRLPECDQCIMRPELCHYREGTCRDAAWGEKHCLKSHIVYLSNTGKVKVGITREANVPFRWIDQGATQALPILKAQERLYSGNLEVLLKSVFQDKTNWRLMLKGKHPSFDLKEIWKTSLVKLKSEIDTLHLQLGEDAFECLDENELQLEYPVLASAEASLVKVLALNLDKTPEISGTLLGIRGQYLILSTGVFNIRKFSSYQCDINIQL